MRLPVGDQSRVVLFGTARFQGEFADHPLSSVRNNIEDLANVLTDRNYGGFLPDTCTTIFGEDVAGPEEVLNQVHAAAEAATDVLLVYIASHAVRGDVAGNELYIALPRTDRKNPAWRYGSLAFDDIRRTIRNSPARLRIVIIDTCYAGVAIPETMGPDHLAISGAATLAAVGPNHKAVAPRGSRHTAFSGALIRLLTDGVEGRGPLLSLSDIFPPLHRALVADQMPAPSLNQSENIDGLALVVNRASDSNRLPPALGVLENTRDTSLRLGALNELIAAFDALSPVVQGLIRDAVTALRDDDSRMIAERAAGFLARFAPDTGRAPYVRRVRQQLPDRGWAAVGLLAALACVLVLWRLDWNLPHAAAAAVPVGFVGYLGAVLSSAVVPAAARKEENRSR